MKRSINRWTTAVATAAILGLPVVGYANTPQDPAPQQQPQPTQPAPQPQPAQPRPQPTDPQPQPGTPRPTDPQPAQPQPQPAQPEPAQQPTAAPTTAPQPDQTVSPQEHLSQAKAAVESITPTAIPAKSRSQLTELKRHLATLDKMNPASPSDSAAAAPKAPGKSSDNWGTEVAAIDKIITEMVGTQTTGATTPGATGTSGSSKAEGAVALDEATRSKLMEVRAHITAYAAGMSGASTPKTEAASPSAAPTAAEPGAATSPAAQASPSAAPAPSAPAAPSATSGAAGQSPTPGTAPATPGEAAQSSPAQSQPAAGAQESAAQPKIDADAARRNLMAARESLSQLTQLPAASQLTGDARAQVAQLISNFNELITSQSNWRASYDKVNANLTTLIGADNSDAEAAGGAATTATGATQAPGAVGTSGAATVELDPAIRAKLVEFRHNLSEFQKASGGGK
jgi:hypothetical protein